MAGDGDDRPMYEAIALDRFRNFAEAQHKFKAQGMSAKFDPEKKGWYATNITQLRSKDKDGELLHHELADAIEQGQVNRAYRFFLGKCGQDECGLWAVPSRKDLSVFYVDQTGTTWQKAFDGTSPEPGTKPDLAKGWTVRIKCEL